MARQDSAVDIIQDSDTHTRYLLHLHIGGGNGLGMRLPHKNVLAYQVAFLSCARRTFFAWSLTKNFVWNIHVLAHLHFLLRCSK